MTSELVERAQRGDHEAFDALASAAYHRLYAIARRILRDGYAAEDAVQDALVKAWRDLRGLRDPEAFDAWLHRSSSTPARPGPADRAGAPSRCPTWPSTGPHPTMTIARLADRDELERAFLISPWSTVRCSSSPTTSACRRRTSRAILGVPPGTVASRLHYGARAMRAAIVRDARTPTTIPEPGR